MGNLVWVGVLNECLNPVPTRTIFHRHNLCHFKGPSQCINLFLVVTKGLFKFQEQKKHHPRCPQNHSIFIVLCCWIIYAEWSGALKVAIFSLATPTKTSSKLLWEFVCLSTGERDWLFLITYQSWAVRYERFYLSPLTNGNCPSVIPLQKL